METRWNDDLNNEERAVSSEEYRELSECVTIGTPHGGGKMTAIVDDKW